MGQELRAVTDAENRDAQVVDARVERRGSVDMHRGRTARQHDGDGLALSDLVRRDRVLHDLGIHVRLPHAASDQLRVLSAEVDNENRGVGNRGQVPEATGPGSHLNPCGVDKWSDHSPTNSVEHPPTGGHVLRESVR